MSRTRDATWIGALLVVPLVFFVSNTEAGRDYAWLGRSVARVSAPVQWAVVRALDAGRHAVTTYAALVGVGRQNEELRGQVGRLNAQLGHLQEAGRENERLRGLLGARTELHRVLGAGCTLFAEVVATAPSPLFRSVRLNRGSKDGVVLGAAVLSDGGVVGRIAAVAATSADVMLLTDAQSSADALVQRSRARVRVRGRGGDAGLHMDAQYLERTADVQPGDVLMTSGLGTTFPKGLLVGRIDAVERRAFGLYQRAQVRPAVDFARLEEVLVLLPPSDPSDDERRER